FSWVNFLKSEDETKQILKDFIRQAENQFNHKVKTIRSDNGTDLKNNKLIEFCRSKGIKRGYSNARTRQQNGVAEKKNITLIEAARTMLADSFLPTTFWAEAVNTTCYVLNRVLVTKPQNKTPYELLTSKQPIISYLKPFGCHMTILNTIDQLGKFDGNSNSGFLVGYSLKSKAFRVYNLETKRVNENVHINFLENKPNVIGKGHAQMFDLDYLTNSMNYEPVSIENQANKSAGPKEANNSASTQANDDQGENSKEIDLHEEYFVLPICTPLSVASPSRAFNDGELSYPDDPLMPHVEDIYASLSEGIFIESSYDEEDVLTDFNNLETTMNVSPTPTTRIHTIHPKTQILRDPMSAVQIRSKVNNNSEAHAIIESIRIFLAFASDMGFIVYQVDVKSAFLYGKIYEDVYVSHPPSFVDLKFPNKKTWCDEFEELIMNRFQMSSMGELTFFLSVKTTSTPIETRKPLVKDEEAADVDVHLYRFQVTSKTSHLQAVKRIFRGAYKKKLIQVLKIHTDDNVDDLLIKAFDVSRFNFL
nr:putative ribonuclease H-like domain-containing protein [Tanacetum cinerariifolium]